jgi:hypothetical protein
MLFLTILFSCRQESKVAQGKADYEEIVIDVKDFKTIPVKDLIDTIEYIKLDSEKCIIGRISQILFVDSLIIVVDKDNSKSVDVFDMSGQHKYKIGSVGQGPAEYVDPWRVTLKPDKKQIVIEDVRQHKILYFSYTGEFEYSERTPFMLNYYEYLDSGYKAFDVRNMKDPAMKDLKDNTLIVTDEDSRVIYGACTDFYSDKFTTVMFNALRKFGNTLYYSPNYSNEIYKVTDTAAILKYKINITNGGMPPLNKNITDELFDDYCRKYSYFNGDYIELDDYTCINIMMPKAYFAFIYSHAKKKSFFFPLLFNKAPLARYKDNCLVVCMEAYEFIKSKESLYKNYPESKELFDKFYEGFTEDSNPVLIFYYLKPDTLNQ